MISNQTSPVNHSAGPLLDGCLGRICTFFSSGIGAGCQADADATASSWTSEQDRVCGVLVAVRLMVMV
jgi:hypothetical protein